MALWNLRVSCSHHPIVHVSSGSPSKRVPNVGRVMTGSGECVRAHAFPRCSRPTPRQTVTLTSLGHHTEGGKVNNGCAREPRMEQCPIQAHHRVRRHALQRLADSEEREDGAGRNRSRRPDRHRRARTSSSTDRAAPTPASTRSARSRTSTSARRLPAETLRRRLNDELPADINILAATQVPHRFHARHDAVARRYLYQIARRRTAFAKPYVWWVKEPLDVERDARAPPRRSSACATSGRSPAGRRRRGRAGAARRWCWSIGSRSSRTATRAGRHRGIALPVEDGAAHRRRAGRRSDAAASRRRRQGHAPARSPTCLLA